VLKNKHVKILVVFKVDLKFIDRFNQLKSEFIEKIVHIDRFIDEGALPDVFACADVFLLPYARSFNSTSGTLPRAAASGVPVISGDHGLVGHRVQEYGLGEVFKIEDPSGMLTKILKIQANTHEVQLRTSAALRDFALSTRIESFEESIGRLFSHVSREVK